MGNVKDKWGKLTDDQPAGKIQETYGVSKDEVEKQISDWERLLK